MANIYIKTETKKMLRRLTKKDNRSLSDEIHFLCEKRLSFLEPKKEKNEIT